MEESILSFLPEWNGPQPITSNIAATRKFHEWLSGDRKKQFTLSMDGFDMYSTGRDRLIVSVSRSRNEILQIRLDTNRGLCAFFYHVLTHHAIVDLPPDMVGDDTIYRSEWYAKNKDVFRPRYGVAAAGWEACARRILSVREDVALGEVARGDDDKSLLDAYEWATSECLCSKTYSLPTVGRVVIHKSCDRFLIHVRIDHCDLYSITTSLDTVLLVHVLMNSDYTNRYRDPVLVVILVIASLFAPWVIWIGIIGLLLYTCLKGNCHYYVHRTDSPASLLDLFNIRHRLMIAKYPSWLLYLKERVEEKRRKKNKNFFYGIGVK